MSTRHGDTVTRRHGENSICLIVLLLCSMTQAAVQTGESVTRRFLVHNPGTGVVVAADSLPTATLYLNGAANAATVTVTAIGGGAYTYAVTMPTLSTNDQVQVEITATVSTVAYTYQAWSDYCDVTTASRSTFAAGGNVNVTQIAGQTANAAGAVTFPAATLAQTGDTMKVSVGTGAGQINVASGVVPASGNWLTTLGTNAPAGWINTAALGTGVLPTQGWPANWSWSTYAGGDTSGTTTLLSRIPQTLTLAQVGGTGPYYVEALTNSGAAIGTSTFASGGTVNVTQWGGSAVGGMPNSGSVALLANQHVIVDSGTVTNLTNAPTNGDFTAAMKASITAAVPPGGDTPGTTTLLARVTDARATKLDNLDAAVSSRSTYAGGAADANAAAIKAKTDNLPAVPAAKSDVQVTVATTQPAVTVTAPDVKVTVIEGDTQTVKVNGQVVSEKHITVK